MSPTPLPKPKKRRQANIINIPKGKWVLTVFEMDTFDGCMASKDGAFIVTVNLPKGLLWLERWGNHEG